MIGLIDEVAFIMVQETRFWVQFSVIQFFAAYIPLSLAFDGPVGTTASKQKQSATIATTHTQ
jgi:hypothetical protein